MARGSPRDQRHTRGVEIATETPELSHDAIRDELERLVSSATFSQSESLKKFLRYIVEAKLEGRDGELKELVLGSEVFERGDAYDPRLDPIVRVQATRLRAKLREYYASDSSPPDVRIDLPKGSYVPQFSTTAEGGLASPPAGRRWRWLGVVGAVLVFAVVVTLVAREAAAPRTGAVERVGSLIVLPFTDMSPERDQEFRGDGMADEITTTLARAEGLDVVPRTTAFTFRGKELSLIARTLGVDAALQGSVRKSGERIRVAAQLIRLADGRQIWSASYDEDDDELFWVQETIARDVAAAVARELRPDAGRGHAGHVPVPEAYETYLRGRFALMQASPASVSRAVELFERAIEIDPRYGRAFAGLVQSYVLNVLWGSTPPSATRELAREASERALELEGDHPEALAAAAAYELIYGWNLAKSGELLSRATSENEGWHVVRGLAYLAEARLEEAARELATASRLAPDAPFVHYLRAAVSFYAGRYDEALERCRELASWAPDYALTSLLRSRILLEQGELEAAARALEALEAKAGKTAPGLTSRALLLARRGDEAAAEEALSELRTSSDHVPRGFVARALAGLGRPEAALSELEEALRDRSLPILTLQVEPDFQSLRGRPRFQALVERAGLSH